ncbi:DEAD/DEAH box helicase [Streptomyces huasconensis]|uniref:DEAD/DEAH box helicase n=1 Tax=Streptomyces huasconensis TaxID=1854574 RepID=UPI00340A2CE2
MNGTEEFSCARKAQRDGYFTPVNYRAVLSLEDTDQALAQLAVTQLCADLDAGLDHIVMARARSIARAKELGVLYQSLAPELNPTVLHEKVATRDRRAALATLEDQSCRIVVCVDMLGEGFDLPALKIATLHDVQKSLSAMIQFIGRFARSTSINSTIGTASVFVARDPSVALSPLRKLLREDADRGTICTTSPNAPQRAWRSSATSRPPSPTPRKRCRSRCWNPG